MYQATPKRENHPLLSYVIGFMFIALTLIVAVGVLHHLTLSPYGPLLLKPIKERFFTQPVSTILQEARRNEELEIHRHFHRIVETPQLAENDRSVCYICHSDYPHSKNNKIRSLLNMHTQYFVCEACHIKEPPNATVVYKWYNPYRENPSGPFVGTSYDPRTGNLMEVEDLISKMAPYLPKGGKLEFAIQRQDAPLAKDYMKVRDKLSPEQRDGVKKKFHINIKPKGPECQACHAKEGLLDFKRLGFDDNRAAKLKRLKIKGKLTQDEGLFLPRLSN